MTAEAEDLLDLLWEQAQGLVPLVTLAETRLAREPDPPLGAWGAAVPGHSPRERPQGLKESELQARLNRAREFIADFDRVIASDIGRSGRNLPSGLRTHLHGQTRILASASRDFVARDTLLKEVKAFAVTGAGPLLFAEVQDLVDQVPFGAPAPRYGGRSSTGAWPRAGTTRWPSSPTTTPTGTWRRSPSPSDSMPATTAGRQARHPRDSQGCHWRP